MVPVFVGSNPITHPRKNDNFRQKVVVFFTLHSSLKLSFQRRVILSGNRAVTIVYADREAVTITQNEAEMDIRAREAVKAAIHKAKICKKPIARYDRTTRKVYIETVDGGV